MAFSKFEIRNGECEMRRGALKMKTKGHAAGDCRSVRAAAA